MNGNEAGDSPSSGHVERFIVCAVVFAVMIVVFTKVSHHHEYDFTSVVQTEPIEKSEVVPETVGPSLAEFITEPKSREIMDDLSEMDKAAKFYYPIILKASRKHKVDPLLVKAIIVAESGFNPRAVSRMGARGLMQLMPRTARSLGLKDSFDPEKNIDAGVRYFKKLLVGFNGDVSLALAAYNAGIGKVRQHGGIPPLSQTMRYVKKVSKLHMTFKKNEMNAVEES